MSRRQLLFRLLEKIEKGNQYVYTQLNEMSQQCSPPPMIKRLQILPVGSGKIQAPISHNKGAHLYEKQKSSNARRVFVVQKVKNMERTFQSGKVAPLNNSLSQPNQNLNKQPMFYLNSKAKSIKKIDDLSIQNATTQPQSPIRKQCTYKRSFCITSPMKTNAKFIKESVLAKTQKNHIFKPNQSRVESARNQSQQLFRSNNNGKAKLCATQIQSPTSRKNDQQRNKILSYKEMSKNYSKIFQAPPKISAKSYIVYEVLEQSQERKSNIRIHAAFNSKVKMEIASLTKIMTCILAIQICQKLNLDSKAQEIKIGKFETSIGGTTANIQMGDVYNLHDLLHGLMLPSGNDASVAIAVWGGKRLIQHKEKSENLFERKKMKKQCYDRFIQEMNVKALQLQMTKTTYANSHGLINLLNRSCTHDIAILSHYCMRNKYFRSIVGCKKYDTIIRVQTRIRIEKMESKIKLIEENRCKMLPKSINDEDQQFSDIDSQTCSQISNNDPQSVEKKVIQQKIIITQRQILWENTHKLLHKYPHEYLGIKTGVTTVAGPCLSSCIQTEGGRNIFIVVLNCKKLNWRFKQTEALKKWVFRKEGLRKMPKKSLYMNSKMQIQSEVANSQNQSQTIGDFQSPKDPYD